jgi:hypothetical protein
MKKNYYYIVPYHQNEPLCIVHTNNIGKAIENYPQCEYSPCPYTLDDIYTLGEAIEYLY